MTEPDPTSRAPAKTWLGWTVRVVVVIIIGWWLYTNTDLNNLVEAIKRIDVLIFLAALGLVGVNMGLAAFRWRALMQAFGAQGIPDWPVLLRLILIGQFYNTFVPGSVGGDVVRAYVARTCFEDATSSFAVVISDRIVGLSALAMILLLGLIIGPPLVDFSTIMPWLLAIIGIGIVLGFSGFASTRIKTIWARIPTISEPRGVVVAGGLSGCAHGCTILAFALLSSTLNINLGLTDLLLIVPLALIAGVIPLAIAGIGPREAALVGLLGLLGIAQDEALALSLCFASTILLVGLLGGLLQLTHGYDGLPSATSDSDTTQSSDAIPPQG